MKRTVALVLVMLILFTWISVGRTQDIQQVEGLNRVGPIDPNYGYPLWYEDKTGLKLQLCLDPGNCFLETPDPTRPLYMPKTLDDPNANFPDEIFYFAAESIFASSVQKGVRAVLVQALEGMFFSDAGVIPGDQAVMSRIRIRIDGLQEGETYTVIFPYGRMTFVAEADAGAGAAKGPGLSMTRDIGLIGPLEFSGPLPGDIGPFLVPVGFDPLNPTPFIADGGLTEVPVTGSPLGTNVFRIEGPGVGDVYPDFRCADVTPLGPNPIRPNDCAESFHFSVMGQVATRFGVTIDRAVYSKEKDADNMDQIHVNVWARSIEGQDLVATIDGGQAQNLSEGVDGNYFGRLLVPAGQIPQEVKVTNITDDPPFWDNAKITEEVTVQEATYSVGSGLTVTVQSSNRVDPASMTVLLKNAQVTRPEVQASPPSFPLTDQGNGLATGTRPVVGPGDQPHFKVVVKSGSGVVTESKVAVLGMPTQGGVMDGLMAIAGADKTVTANGQTVMLNGGESLGPLSMVYSWSHDDTSGLIRLIDPNSAQTGFVTPQENPPLPGGRLVVNFTLTVRDGTNVHSDSVSITMIQPSILPVDKCIITEALYRARKERWVVEGNCDLGDNQVIEVWLGNETNTKMVLVGKTLVDEAGFWAVSPGNRSAAENNSIPDPTIHTKIRVISSRGFDAVMDYNILF